MRREPRLERLAAASRALRRRLDQLDRDELQRLLEALEAVLDRDELDPDAVELLERRLLL